MKKFFATILLLLPMAAIAQDMMVQMQEMAVCMQSIDQKEMKALGEESDAFEKEMKGLCNAGKRDEAQSKAIEFSKKMLNSSAIKTMVKCTEKIPASMKQMMPNMDPEEIAKDYRNHHVCDEI
jgi:predicted lipoprotein